MIFAPEYILLMLLGVWQLIITVIFIKFYLYYSRASKKGEKKSLITLIDSVLEAEELNKKALAKVSAQYDTLIKDISFNIQKVGLVRFNPFKDTGGDQSFVLALTDAHDTGVIISSYHTRGGTRWYAKRVINGKGIEHDLTKEELQVLQEAQSIKTS
jgi:hypothetical protein